jgi:hypothetical protein
MLCLSVSGTVPDTFISINLHRTYERFELLDIFYKEIINLSSITQLRKSQNLQQDQWGSKPHTDSSCYTSGNDCVHLGTPLGPSCPAPISSHSFLSSSPSFSLSSSLLYIWLFAYLMRLGIFIMNNKDL